MRLEIRTLALVVVLLVGCASSDFLTEIPRPKLTPDPARATVVFLRPTMDAPSTRVTIVDSRRRFLGDSVPGGCFVTTVEPGAHLFVGWADNTTGMSAQVDAAKIYYVDVVMRLGAGSSRTNLIGIPAGATTPGAAPGAAPGATPGTAEKAAAHIRAALEDCTFYRVDERAGQAWVVKHAPEAIDRVRRAQEIVARYDLEARRTRSLRSEDGRTE